MKTTIPLVSGGKPMMADMYDAAEGVSQGLIVIAYGSAGLTNDLSGPWKTMFEGYAASLADKGFGAVILDYLSITGTPPDPTVLDAMFHLRDTWQTALSDGTDQVIALSKLDPKRVGLLGFSLGGHLALRLRAKEKGLVAFFAPVLDGIGAPGTLAHAQIHHGQSDKLPDTGFPNASAIEGTLKQEGTAPELYPYPGAGHGFIGADQANQSARDLSKARTLSFFQTNL